jgi:hypothetical protein
MKSQILALAAALLLLAGCSAADLQTTSDILNALGGTPTTVQCSQIEQNANGSYCSGQLCQANSGSCDASGCTCTLAGNVVTPPPEHHRDHD